MVRKKGEDSEEQLEWLIEKLPKKSVNEIICFDSLFNKNYTKPCTFKLWAAASIIMVAAQMILLTIFGLVFF